MPKNHTVVEEDGEAEKFLREKVDSVMEALWHRMR
jgi:hypothetical protein